MNVNRSLIHKTIITIIFSIITVWSWWTCYSAESGSGLQILSFLIALVTGLAIGTFLAYYAWYALFESDKYTFQEWHEK